MLIAGDDGPVVEGDISAGQEDTWHLQGDIRVSQLHEEAYSAVKTIRASLPVCACCVSAACLLQLFCTAK